MDNTGAPPQRNLTPPQGNQVPPHEQSPVIPIPMTDGEIRSNFLRLAQFMSTQDHVVSTQALGIKTQANLEVRHRVQQNASMVASPVWY